MPRTKDQFDQMRDTTKTLIIQGSIKIFSEKGFSATKISDISKEINISTGLIYHYFSSKEELFLFIVKECVEMSSSAMEKLKEAPLQPKEKIQMVSQMMVEQAFKDDIAARRFMVMIHSGLARQELKIDEEIGVKSRISLCVLAEIIKEGQKLGQFKEGSPQVLAQVYWATVQGLCMYKLVSDDFFKEVDASILSGILIKD